MNRPVSEETRRRRNDDARNYRQRKRAEYDALIRENGELRETVRSLREQCATLRALLHRAGPLATAEPASPGATDSSAETLEELFDTEPLLWHQ
jgi:hypothetical protein